MTLEEILSTNYVDRAHWSRSQWEELVLSASPKVKQRVTNINKKLGGSPATIGLFKDIGRNDEGSPTYRTLPTNADIKNYSINDLKFFGSAYTRFLRTKTSLVPGAEDTMRKAVQTAMKPREFYKSDKAYKGAVTRLINQLGGYQNLNEMYSKLDELRRNNPHLVSQYGTNDPDNPEKSGLFKAFVTIYKQDPTMSVDDIVERLEAQYAEYTSRSLVRNESFH